MNARNIKLPGLGKLVLQYSALMLCRKFSIFASITTS